MVRQKKILVRGLAREMENMWMMWQVMEKFAVFVLLSLDLALRARDTREPFSY